MQKAFILFSPIFIIFFFSVAVAGDVYYNSKGEKIIMKTPRKPFNLLARKHSYIIGETGKYYKLSKQGVAILEGKSGIFSGLIEDWQSNDSQDGLIARTGEAISAFHPGDENKIIYILKESNDIPGSMMNQKVNLSETKLFVFNDRAYNSNEAGNVIWGAAMNIFGFNPTLTWCCSHGGTFLLKRRLDEHSEAIAAYKGSRYMKRFSRGSTKQEIIQRYAGTSRKNNSSYRFASLINSLTSF